MDNSPHRIPAIFHMEGICGPFIQEAVSLPSGMARGAGFHPELEEEIGGIVAAQEAACGMTHILAPVLDVTRDAQMGRHGESYGEDPALAAALGAAYVRGVRNIRMDGRAPESVAKHFLAFHNSQGGIHGAHSDTPGRLLREVYAKPFQAAIRAGLRVLTAKFRMGLFEHPFALEGEELRAVFHGPAGARAAEVTRQSALESLVLMKNDGTLPLDGKRLRKLALVGPHGGNARRFFGGYTHLSMMESTFAVANSIAGVAGIENLSGREIETVPGTSIQSDLTEEFDPILRRQKPGCPSLLDALRAALPDTEIVYAPGYPIAGDDRSGFDEALALIAGADAAVLTLGGKYGTCSIASMGEGVDGTDINLPPCQEAFLRKAAELGKPLVGVHFDGRPISSDGADQCLNAILEAWAPGEAGGGAVVDVLTGRYNPGGKLPVSVAYHAGQIPVYYNHPWGSCEHQGESIGFASYVDLPHTPAIPSGTGCPIRSFSMMTCVSPPMRSGRRSRWKCR